MRTETNWTVNNIHFRLFQKTGPPPDPTQHGSGSGCALWPVTGSQRIGDRHEHLVTVLVYLLRSQSVLLLGSSSPHGNVSLSCCLSPVLVRRVSCRLPHSIEVAQPLLCESPASLETFKDTALSFVRLGDCLHGFNLCLSFLALTLVTFPLFLPFKDIFYFACFF